MIQSENPDTPIGKLAGDPHHVVAAVTTREAVHQDGERAAWPPGRRAVVVQDQNVAIRKLNNVPPRRIAPLFTRQEVAQQSLPMATSREEQRTQSGFDRMIHWGHFLTRGFDWLLDERCSDYAATRIGNQPTSKGMSFDGFLMIL